MMAGAASDIAETGIANGIVDDPTKSAEAPVAKLMTVSETVMAEPGTTVLPPITTAEPKLAEMIAIFLDSVRGGADECTAETWVFSTGCTVGFSDVEDFTTVVDGPKVIAETTRADTIDEPCATDVVASLIEGTFCFPGVPVEEEGMACSELRCGDNIVLWGMVAVVKILVDCGVVLDGFKAGVEDE